MIQHIRDIVESKHFPKLVDFLKYSSGLIIACYVIYRLFGMLDILPDKLDVIISKLDTCISHPDRVAFKRD